MQTGKMMQYIPEDGVYVYFRYDDQKTVMIVYNGRDKEQNHYYRTIAERINGAKKARNVITDGTVDLSKLMLGAKSTLVLELLPQVIPIK